MAKHGMKLMDSDMHIIEPPDLTEGDPHVRRPWRGCGARRSSSTPGV